MRQEEQNAASRLGNALERIRTYNKKKLNN